MIAHLERLFGFREGLGKGILEHFVDAFGGAGGEIRAGQAYDVETHLVGAAGSGLFEAFVEVIPMEKELTLVGGLVAPGVDGADDELPAAWKDGPFQGDAVADVPVESFRQLGTHRAGPAIAQEGLLLLRRNHKFRIQLQVSFGLDGKVGEKVLLLDVDAAEPVAVRDQFDALDPTNLVLVGERQGEHQGDGIAGHQAIGGRGLDACVPGADHRA